MSTFPFGADFTCWFFPLVDDSTPEGVGSSAVLEGIYLYGPDSMPSRDNASDGTGAIATISTWTWDDARQGFSFTVPAITDPYPDNATSVRTYWLGINFRLQAAPAQVQTVLRSMYVERVKGPAQAVYVTDDDLAGYYNEIASYTSADQRQKAIGLALLSVKAELKAKKYRWAQIHNAEELKAAVTLKALTILCLSKVQQGNDKFLIKYTAFKELYETQVGGLVALEYDSNGDGTVDTEATPQADTIFVVR